MYGTSSSAASNDYSQAVKRGSKLTSYKLMKQGERFEKKGEIDSALVCYMIVCNRSGEDQTDQDIAQCAIANLKAGNIYYGQGNYVNALEFYVKGLKIYETSRDQREIARFYNNIGSIYCQFQDYEKGLNYYKKGYDYCKRYGDKQNQYKLLVNMTGIYTFKGDIRNARHYYQETRKLEDPHNAENKFMDRFNLCLILSAENKPGVAINILRPLVAYSQTTGIKEQYVCSAYQQLYKNYSTLGRTDSALVYLKLCKHTAQKAGIMHSFIEVFRDYANLYEKMGDIAKANSYRANYLKLKDSIYDTREFDVIKNYQFQYEMDKTNQEISRLNIKEKERSTTIKQQRLAIGSIVIVTMVVSILLAILYRQKRRIDNNYNNLFEINQHFIATQEQMKNRIRELQEKLDDKNNGEKDNAQPKYQTSNLNASRKDVLANSITDVMENTTEYCNTDFTLDRLSMLVGSNSKYVSQAINDTFKKNFSNYVNEYRVREACLRLSDTKHYGNYTLRAIAESVGFKSYTTFVATFRKQTGIMPSLYQEKASGQDNA